LSILCRCERTRQKQERNIKVRAGKASRLAKVFEIQVLSFLKSPVFHDRDAAVRLFLKKHEGKPSEMVFRQLIPLSSAQIMKIWKHAQKSNEWLRARLPRKTGSEGGTLLNWNPYCNVLKQAHRKFYDIYRSNEATEHGNEYEKKSGKIYIDQLQKTLNQMYVDQKGYLTGYLMIANRRIPLTKSQKGFMAPRAQMWSTGMVDDAFNHWRGVSIDGLVTINGIPLILVEIKCPYGKGYYDLYINDPLYYFPYVSSSSAGM
jgi:hypothetical protein